MASSDLIFRLLGVDVSASRAVAGVGKAAELTALSNESAARRSEAAWAKMGKAMDVAGKLSAALVVGIGVEGVKAATSFEQAMTRIHTQAGVSTQGVAALSKAVLALAPQVGVGPNELAAGLYHVESAFQSTGITGVRAMNILKVAAEGARVGGSDLVDTTNALDAAIVSGIPGVQNFQQAMGALNKIVGSGDMTMQDLADAFGTGAVAVVKNYGLSLTDVGAALATFGDNNIRGADAGTALRMSVMALAKPVAGGAVALKAMGIQSGQLATDMQHGGLNQAMKDLADHMNAAGITGNKVGEFITTAFGKKAGVGLAVLAGQFDRFESKFHETAAGAASFSNAWAGQQTTLKQKMADLAQAWKVFEIEVGQKIIPVLKDVLTYLSAHPKLIKDAAEAVGVLAGAWALFKIGQITQGLYGMSRAILGIGAASTTAAAESTAANLGAGAAGAGAADAAGWGAAGAAGRSARLRSVVKMVIPVAIGYEVLNAAGAWPAVNDALNGQFAKIPNDEPAWGKALGAWYSRQVNGALSGTVSGPIGRDLTPLDPFKTGADRLKNQLDGLDFQMAHLFEQGKYGSPAFAAIQQQIADVKKQLADLNGQANVATYLKSLAMAKQSADAAAAKTNPGNGPIFTDAGSPGKGLFGDLGALKAIKDIQAYQLVLHGLGGMVDSTSKALDGNTVAGVKNRDVLITLLQKAQSVAHQYADSTGKASDFTKIMNMSVPQIEQVATSLGFNREKVDQLIASLGLMPPEKSVHIQTPGMDTANVELQTFLNMLARIPAQQTVDIQVQTTGVASAAAIANATAGGRGGVGYATGTLSAMRGLHWVGEKGPELVRFGGGEQVYNAAQSAAMAGGGSPVQVVIQAWDGQSVDRWLRHGGTAQLAQALARGGVNGMQVNG